MSLAFHIEQLILSKSKNAKLYEGDLYAPEKRGQK